MALDLVTAGETDEVEEVVLFTVDGVPYTIPNKVRVNLHLKYLNALRTKGEVEATGILLAELLGEEGFEALSNYEKLTQEQFDLVVSSAQKVAFGETEVNLAGKAQGKKKSGRGR